MQNENYYYFVSTLLPVNYGEEPPVSSEDFREQCYLHLKQEDADLLQYCYYDPKLAVETIVSTGSNFIDLLMLRERVLILNLACFRAAKLNRHAPVDDPPYDVPRTVAMGKTAFEMEDPLEAAIYIDKGRWESLDNAMDINYFGVNTIYSYLLKLQLMERRWAFDAVKGAAEYHQLYDTILNEYNSKKEDKR